MSVSFTIPLPADYSADELDYSDAEIDAILADIKAAWGRDPLPGGGGFDLVLRVPGAGDVPKEVQRSIAGYVALLLQDAGVLSERPARMGLTAEGGAASPEALVVPGMLMWPDGTPAVLPRREAPCAAS